MIDKETYKSNPNLKRANVKQDWTKEQIEEFVKCSENPVYFITNYVKIIHVDRGIIPFEMWPFQERMVQVMINNRFSIHKLSRQIGKTTCVAAVMLWYTLFYDNFKIGILAHKEKQAKEIIERYQIAYENLPKWMQQGVIEWNKTSVTLENGSSLDSSATTSGALRGMALNLIYLDEFAHVPANIQAAFYESVFPTVTSGESTKIIVTSTPKGLNFYHRLWDQAEKKKSRFVAFEAYWYDVPGRGDEWKAEILKDIPEQQWRQEFDCEFIGSSNTLIDAKKLLGLVEEEPISVSSNYDTAIFEEPNENHMYVMTVDTARGVDNDASATVVFDVTTFPYKVVARFCSNAVESLVYPNVLYTLGKRYNDAFMLIEVNDLGQQVVDILHNEFEYENLFWSQHRGNYGQQIGTGFGDIQSKLGVTTSKKVKRVGCANLKQLIENDKLLPIDQDIIKELYTFVQVKDSYEAEPGSGAHDDLAMCLVLFAWLTTQPYFKELTDHNVRQSILENRQKLIEDNLTPVGIISHGVIDGHFEDDDFENGAELTSEQWDRFFDF